MDVSGAMIVAVSVPVIMRVGGMTVVTMVVVVVAAQL